MKPTMSWTGRSVAASEPKKTGAAPNKYGAHKVVVAGIKYDSKAESRRHQALLRLEQLGVIRDLRRQVTFTLVPSVRFDGAKRQQPPMVYIADFVYLDDKGLQVIEDVKGMQTPAFKLKRHLLLALHGLHIKLVKAR